MVDGMDDDQPDTMAAAPPTEQAPAGDAVAVAPTAWSAEPDFEDELPAGGRSWGSVSGIAALIVTLGGVVAVLVWLVGRPALHTVIAREAVPPSSSVTVTVAPAVPAEPTVKAPPTPSAASLLNGTYRIDYDWANQTYRNNKTASGGTVHFDHSALPDTIWWAFASTCGGMDCTAAGVALDSVDHSQVSSSSGTDVLRFVDGVWVDVTPYHSTSTCTYVSDGAFMGTSNESRAWNFTPLADGSFRGEMVATVESDGCGDRGNTTVTPLIVTRIGDVPPGVMVNATS